MAESWLVELRETLVSSAPARWPPSLPSSSTLASTSRTSSTRLATRTSPPRCAGCPRLCSPLPPPHQHHRPPPPPATAIAPHHHGHLDRLDHRRRRRRRRCPFPPQTLGLELVIFYGAEIVGGFVASSMLDSSSSSEQVACRRTLVFFAASPSPATSSLLERSPRDRRRRLVQRLHVRGRDRSRPRHARVSALDARLLLLGLLRLAGPSLRHVDHQDHVRRGPRAGARRRLAP